MPTIPPSSKILVTGGTGYIGAWVVKFLLDRGLAVRAVVRSEAKATLLKEVFATEAGDGNLEFSIIEDPFADGALDEAVKGVEGIAHLASPLTVQGDDPDDFIKPAVNGTLGVLKSALKNGSTVKRIIITSSCAAVYTVQSEPGCWSESDWNDAALEQVRAQGKNADVMVKYRASKVLAERAAWDFYKKHQGEVGWDLVVLNPPIVFGPALLPGLTDPSALGESMRYWYHFIIANTPKTAEMLHGSHGWVDVRDVAEAHARSFERADLGGERVIVYAGPFIWQEFVDIVNKIAPSVWPGHEILKGFPIEEKAYRVRYSTEKQEKLLGLKYHTKEETTRDILEDFKKRGW
ncbi:D-lactaldehyde dehydrogenase [Coprinellus micaceus]|uniref:D-lactaldehyde dehydrogenase n=1 Tax=Coprinellus micaceus TaxID=71717 RepID=A0A4Y7T6J7_COPMI|nr:D-lactaldehyde dehydrogenase [Coprinellus micaceus]